jgi:hypothetical protein
VNRALARFLKDYAFSDPTYRAAVDLVHYPARAGIDPYHELIDAHPEDNVRSL